MNQSKLTWKKSTITTKNVEQQYQAEYSDQGDDFVVTVKPKSDVPDVWLFSITKNQVAIKLPVTWWDGRAAAEAAAEQQLSEIVG